MINAASSGVRRGLWATLVLAVVLIGAGSWYAHGRSLRANLLSADPDSIPAQTSLLDYALPKGRAGFAAHCAVCHGSGLEGDSSRDIPNLGDQDWLYGAGRIGEIERVVLYGIRSGNTKGWNLAVMPAFATPNPNPLYEMASLTPAEIDDVTAYLYSFQHPDQPRGNPNPAVERGMRLFRNQERGLCWDCHDTGGLGDPAIGAPNLTDAIWLSGDGSLAGIRRTVAHGLAGRCPAWSGQLDPGDIRAIAAYVHSRATPSQPHE